MYCLRSREVPALLTLMGAAVGLTSLTTGATATTGEPVTMAMAVPRAVTAVGEARAVLRSAAVTLGLLTRTGRGGWVKRG